MRFIMPRGSWGPNRLKILNVCNHPINFSDEEGNEFYIPPSGHVLNARVEERPLFSKNGLEFVEIKVGPTLEGLDLLRQVPDGVVVVGSKMAAEAYPGLVVCMTPSSQRKERGSRAMNPGKFTVYLRKAKV
jgi:hypothetical protein